MPSWRGKEEYTKSVLLDLYGRLKVRRLSWTISPNLLSSRDLCEVFEGRQSLRMWSDNDVSNYTYYSTNSDVDVVTRSETISPLGDDCR